MDVEDWRDRCGVGWRLEGDGSWEKFDGCIRSEPSGCGIGSSGMPIGAFQRGEVGSSCGQSLSDGVNAERNIVCVVVTGV